MRARAFPLRLSASAPASRFNRHPPPPNNSFKPTPHRGVNSVLCATLHAVATPMRGGLTQALGLRTDIRHTCGIYKEGSDMATKKGPPAKAPMNTKAAARVQSATAKSGDGKVSKNSFPARAQSAAANNATTQKTTQSPAAKAASQSLTNKSTGTATRSAAGSALSQVKPSRVTSPNAAKAASAVLRDGRTSSTSKSTAGSALAQRPPAKKR